MKKSDVGKTILPIFMAAVLAFFWPVSVPAGENTTLPASYPMAYDDPGYAGWIWNNLPRVKDQDPFDTCWAHATVSAAEIWMQKNGVGDPDLSEWHLAHWMYTTAKSQSGLSNAGDFCYEIKEADKLLAGGDPDYALELSTQWKGFVPESVLPYPGEDEDDVTYDRDPFSGVITGIHSKKYGDFPDHKSYYAALIDAADDYGDFESPYSEPVLYVDGWKGLAIRKAPELVKDRIREQGAVTVCLTVGDVSKTYNTITNSYYGFEMPKEGDYHAVALVGWDDDYPKERFNNSESLQNNGAWLVRNSLGEDEGLFNLDAYFWLSYEDVTLSEYAYTADYSLPAENENAGRFNYRYDTGRPDSGRSAGKAANIYPILNADYERIESVSFVCDKTTDEKPAPVSIDIFENNVENDPESGDLLMHLETEVSSYGRYCVPLPEAVVVKKGSRVSVCIRTWGKTAVLSELGVYEWNHSVGASVGDHVGTGENESFGFRKGKWIPWEGTEKDYSFERDGKTIKQLVSTGNLSIGLITSASDEEAYQEYCQAKEEASASGGNAYQSISANGRIHGKKTKVCIETGWKTELSGEKFSPEALEIRTDLSSLTEKVSLPEGKDRSCAQDLFSVEYENRKRRTGGAFVVRLKFSKKAAAELKLSKKEIQDWIRLVKKLNKESRASPCRYSLSVSD